MITYYGCEETDDVIIGEYTIKASYGFDGVCWKTVYYNDKDIMSLHSHDDALIYVNDRIRTDKRIAELEAKVARLKMLKDLPF